MGGIALGCDHARIVSLCWAFCRAIAGAAAKCSGVATGVHATGDYSANPERMWQKTARSYMRILVWTRTRNSSSMPLTFLSCLSLRHRLTAQICNGISEEYHVMRVRHPRTDPRPRADRHPGIFLREQSCRSDWSGQIPHLAVDKCIGFCKAL